MADIRPFRGVRYNQEVVRDLSRVVCPPYDIISPSEQQELYGRSEYNYIRIEDNPESGEDNGEDNKYTRSAATLADWIEDGVLRYEDEPALYLHDHSFSWDGKRYTRRGLIARVHLEEWDSMIVRPHEDTLSKAKSDRVKLLQHCQGNTSGIMSLYEDTGDAVASVLEEQERNKPVMQFTEVNGEIHTVWAITDREAVEKIHSALAETPLYIADGHHRYESALLCSRERHADEINPEYNRSWDYVMMTLFEFNDPGLLLLPPHRLVEKLPQSAVDALPEKLAEYFTVDTLASDVPDFWQKIEAFLDSEEGQQRLVMGQYGTDHVLLLQLFNRDAVNGVMPAGRSAIYREIMVSVVDHMILQKLLEVHDVKEGGVVSFSHDRKDALERTLNGEFQLVFLLGQMKSEVVKNIADVKDRMPRKSTYFFPKLPSGLVVNCWE